MYMFTMALVNSLETQKNTTRHRLLNRVRFRVHETKVPVSSREEFAFPKVVTIHRQGSRPFMEAEVNRIGKHKSNCRPNPSANCQPASVVRRNVRREEKHFTWWQAVKPNLNARRFPFSERKKNHSFSIIDTRSLLLWFPLVFVKS